MIVTRKKSHSRRCVICGRKFYSFGHIAAPIAEGRCCDRCHDEHVLPEHRRAMREDMEFAELLHRRT